MIVGSQPMSFGGLFHRSSRSVGALGQRGDRDDRESLPGLRRRAARRAGPRARGIERDVGSRAGVGDRVAGASWRARRGRRGRRRGGRRILGGGRRGDRSDQEREQPDRGQPGSTAPSGGARCGDLHRSSSCPFLHRTIRALAHGAAGGAPPLVTLPGRVTRVIGGPGHLLPPEVVGRHKAARRQSTTTISWDLNVGDDLVAGVGDVAASPRAGRRSRWSLPCCVSSAKVMPGLISTGWSSDQMREMTGWSYWARPSPWPQRLAAAWSSSS